MKKERNENKDRSKRNPLAWIVGVSTTRPKTTLLVFFIITMIFMAFASQLTIDSSMESAFGEDLPEEVEDFQDVADEFGEQELVTIVVDCSKSNATVAQMFLEDLAGVLSENDWFKDIQYTQDMNFAGEHAILYYPEEFLYFVLDENATPESVNATHDALITAMNSPSYLVSENGNIYLLNMILNRTIDSAEIRTEIFDGLYEILDDVQDSDPQYKDLKVGFTGSLVVYDYEGDKMALNDMYATMGLTFLLILIILFVSFRSISLPLLSLIPLLCGIIITGGLIAIIYGALGIIAAVFAVLLMGLGIDFSIHILTRFMEEMEKYNDIHKAFRHTSISTGKAVVLGTLTTATAFGALAFSKTEGMHQMGIVLFIGLIVTMVCVFFILPALITLRLRKGKLREKMGKRARFEMLGAIGKCSRRFAIPLIVLLIILVAFFAYKAPEARLNEDLYELMPKTVPAYKQLEKVKENFNYTEDYLLCVVDSFDELVSTVEGFRAIPEVMGVESILDYLPQNQGWKLAIFDQAKSIHPEFQSVSWMNIDEITWQYLPESIRSNWISGDSGNERFLIRIKAWGNVWNEDYREALLVELRAVNPHIVGRAIMFTVLIDAMTDDVIRVTFYAGIPIFIIVFIGFRKRNPVYALLALVPVAFGVGGILGLYEYLGISLNMVSIMMIPLVVGIGIDDGIHILHRYKEEGNGSIPKVIQNTGKAIFLTTATTCLAFSSFTFAEHPGMRALGQVPVLGLVLAFLAAIIFLPALIGIILERRGKEELEEVPDRPESLADEV